MTNAWAAHWRDLYASPVRKRILGEGAWIVAGQLLGAIGLLAGIRLLTEFVTPEVFGTVALLVGIVTLGSSIFCAPQLQAALRFYPDLERHKAAHRLRATIGRNLRWTTSLLVAAILLCGVPASRWSDISYWAFVALAALLAAEITRTFETNLLTAARRQKAFSLWGAMENWCRPLLAVIGVMLVGSTPAAVLGGYAVATAGLLMIIPLKIDLEGRAISAEGQIAAFDKELAYKIWHYAVPLMPLAVVGWISSLSDRYIIGSLVDMHAVGIYAAAYGLISRPFLMVHGMVSTTLRPVYFESVSNGNVGSAKRLFRVWLIVCLVFSTAGVMFVVVLDGWIAQLLLAEEFRASKPLMPWIALGFALQVLYFTFAQYFYASKETHLILVIQVIGGVAAIVVTFPLVFWLGTFGAALAVPVCFGIHLAVAIVLWNSSRARKFHKAR